MYRSPDGTEYYVVDSHVHWWNASNENYRNPTYGDGWIRCFYDYHRNLSPADYVWPFELAVLLWPTGMVQVLDGTVHDGYGGILGWFWAACAIGTIVLCLVTRAALKERAYSAVMAATGLLYLAILTAFGMDLVARAILAR